MPGNKNFKKALVYALRLLKLRQRSEKELREKFRIRRYSQSVIESVLRHLKRTGLVDDVSFAQAWVQTKMALRPSGLFRLSYELKKKGIAPEIIRDILGKTKQKYDLQEIALNLGRRKIHGSKVENKEKLRRRVYDYLRRRGFSNEIVFSAMQELFKDFESENY